MRCSRAVVPLLVVVSVAVAVSLWLVRAARAVSSRRQYQSLSNRQSRSCPTGDGVVARAGVRLRIHGLIAVESFSDALAEVVSTRTNCVLKLFVSVSEKPSDRSRSSPTCRSGCRPPFESKSPPISVNVIAPSVCVAGGRAMSLLVSVSVSLDVALVGVEFVSVPCAGRRRFGDRPVSTLPLRVSVSPLVSRPSAPTSLWLVSPPRAAAVVAAQAVRR